MNNPNHALDHNQYAALTGAQIVTMMRRERVTIKALAATMDITQKRVRELRARGVQSGLPAWEIWTSIWDARHKSRRTVCGRIRFV